MRGRWPLSGLALACVTFLTGCDVAGTVVDRSNTETQVMNMYLSGSGMMKVICGAGIKEVPLESFESITLFPDETRIIEGDLCFAADVTMRDGTRLHSREKSRDSTPRTYISVNQTLTGTSHRGNFTIELSGVSKIIFR
jgi:hypothetical protein